MPDKSHSEATANGSTDSPPPPPGRAEIEVEPMEALCDDAYGTLCRALDAANDRLVIAEYPRVIPDGVSRAAYDATLAALIALPEDDAVVRPIAWALDSSPPIAVFDNCPQLETLAARVAASGPLNEDAVAEMLIGVLGALELAHGAGLAHGGLTPECVLLIENAPARVADFALPPGEAWRGLAIGARARQDEHIREPYRAPRLDGHDDIENADMSLEARQHADLFAVGGLAVFALIGETPSRNPVRQLTRARVSLVFRRLVDRLADTNRITRYRDAASARQVVYTVLIGRAMAPRGSSDGAAARTEGEPRRLFASAKPAAGSRADDDDAWLSPRTRSLIVTVVVLLIAATLILWFFGPALGSRGTSVDRSRPIRSRPPASPADAGR